MGTDKTTEELLAEANKRIEELEGYEGLAMTILKSVETFLDDHNEHARFQRHLVGAKLHAERCRELRQEGKM